MTVLHIRPSLTFLTGMPLTELCEEGSLQVTKLCDLGGEEDEGGQSSPPDTVCSVSWSQKGTYLSVGTDSGRALIWDVSKTTL